MPNGIVNNIHNLPNTGFWKELGEINFREVCQNNEGKEGIDRRLCNQRLLLQKGREKINISFNPMKEHITLEYDYEIDDWKKVFSRLNKLSICNRDRSFYFRTMHFLNATTYELMLKGIENYNSAACSYCNAAKQNKWHLYIDCPTSQFYYKTIEKAFYVIFEEPISDLTKLIGHNKFSKSNEYEVQITLIIYVYCNSRAF